MKQDILPIYIGWDSREPVAFDVCAYSLWRRTSMALMVSPLKERALRAMKILWREPDALASTEFTYSRFLTPWLAWRAGFKDVWAIFCDCDFLFQADIAKLFDVLDNQFAVMVVKHDHRPPETTKMEGAIQHQYPRKNWSSFIAWNLGDPANACVVPALVNEWPAGDLHQFKWLPDAKIGALPEGWNWLEGHSHHGLQKHAIHYTRGGPWFKNWAGVSYAGLWETERRVMEAQLRPSFNGGLPRMEAG